MPRYIDAELLESKYHEGTDPQDPYSEITYLLPEDVESIPTADAEPVRHGRWIRMYGDDYECSECQAAVWSRPPNPIERYKYCWSCGAKMDVSRNEVC